MDPRSVVRWLRRPHVATTLKGMATGEFPVAHSTIDLLPPGPGTRYFRRLLIAAEVLPSIHVLQHELTAHVAAVAATLSPASANMVRRFYRWDLLPKLHRKYRDQGRDLSAGAFINQRGRIAVIVRFLGWMDGHGLALADLDQSSLDRYTARIKVRGPVDHFVRWATRSRLAADLAIYPTGAPNPTTTMTEEELWRATDLLLESETIELAVRVVGLLTLVYAQPLERTVGLTRDRVEVTPHRITIRFGTTPVELEESVAALVRRHLAAPPRRGYAAGESDWLFEGLSPGTHLSAAFARLRLAQHGIGARVSRETRLNLLVMRMPASVVADVIGISNLTADQRKNRAGGTWTSYPGLRP